jgi:hypothetical protein
MHPYRAWPRALCAGKPRSLTPAHTRVTTSNPSARPGMPCSLIRPSQMFMPMYVHVTGRPAQGSRLCQQHDTTRLEKEGQLELSHRISTRAISIVPRPQAPSALTSCIHHRTASVAQTPRRHLNSISATPNGQGVLVTFSDFFSAVACAQEISSANISHN